MSNVRPLTSDSVGTPIQNSVFRPKSVYYSILFPNNTSFLRKNTCHLVTPFVIKKKKNWVKYKEHFVNLEFKVLSLVLAKNVYLPSSFLCIILRKGLTRILRDLKNGWNENKIFILSIFSHTSPGASAASCGHKKETWVYVNPLSSGCRTALIRAALATIYWSSAKKYTKIELILPWVLKGKSYSHS